MDRGQCGTAGTHGMGWPRMGSELEKGLEPAQKWDGKEDETRMGMG